MGKYIPREYTSYYHWKQLQEHPVSADGLELNGLLRIRGLKAKEEVLVKRLLQESRTSWSDLFNERVKIMFYYIITD